MNKYTAKEDEVRDAYRAKVRSETDKRYQRKGRKPLTNEEIDGEFYRFVERIRADALREHAISVRNNVGDQ